jgi:hypothetical protein
MTAALRKPIQRELFREVLTDSFANPDLFGLAAAAVSRVSAAWRLPFGFEQSAACYNQART